MDSAFYSRRPINDFNQNREAPQTSTPSFWDRFSDIANAVTAPFKRALTTQTPPSSPVSPSTPSIQLDFASTDSIHLSEWTVLSSSGEESIDHLLTSWIETEDGYSNKGQRRLAALAIEEFIKSPSETTLDLRDFDLTTLPDVFLHSAFTTRLQTLNLDGNLIASFPSSLENLQCLQEINGVSLSALSKISSKSLSALQIIKIEVSDDLPIICVKPKLEYSLLDAWAMEGSSTENREEAKNRILNFIENKTLLTLDLNNLHLRSLPDIFNGVVFVERLKTLSLFGNELQKEGIPKSVNDLQNLHLIQLEDPISNLDSWALEDAPGENRFMAWLRIMEFINDSDGNSLDLSGLNLSCLPHIFSHEAFITELHSLDLSYNQLTEIHPTAFLSLKDLRSLNLEHNQLTQIHERICEMTSLKELWLRQNNLYILPSNLGNLSQLEWLDISQNALEELPKSLTNCNRLINFNCSENEIDEISTNFSSLSHLKSLNIADNAFITISPELLRELNSKGVDVILFNLDPEEIQKIARINS